MAQREGGRSQASVLVNPDGEIFEFEGRQFSQQQGPRKLTPEEQAEALERFHDEPRPPRCHVCWNLESCCTCKSAELMAFEAQDHPAWRAQLDRMASGDSELLFSMYVEAGINDLDLLANGKLPPE